MRTARSGFAAAALIVVIGSASTTQAAAADATETIPNHPVLNDKFQFTFGGFYSRASTAASLSPSSGGTGVVVDFEETLSLEKRNLTPSFGFLWRATENWRVELEYFAVGRDATRTLSSDVTWGNQTFTAGATVNSTFNFSDTRLSVAYSIFRRRDKELGVGVGLHVSGLKAEVKSANSSAEAADVLAPLPVVNFYGLFALTDEWALRARADWLSLTYGDYSGDVRSVGVDMLYQPFRHVGFGVGMRSLMMDLAMDGSDWRGKVRLSYQGPTAFISASF